MRKHYDWKKIQESYNEGKSLTDLTVEFGITKANLCKGARRGDLILRSKSEAAKLYLKKNPRKHTDDTKKKISKIRREYLEQNPDKVPYRLNHSSKKSYPEKVFENALIASSITDYTYNYPFGIYQFDFAFVEDKIDVEIDGSTHLQDKVIEIDTRRDKLAKESGWRVLRFTAKEVKDNVIECINRLKELREYGSIGRATGF